jgi:hypothetical protein
MSDRAIVGENVRAQLRSRAGGNEITRSRAEESVIDDVVGQVVRDERVQDLFESEEEEGEGDEGGEGDDEEDEEDEEEDEEDEEEGEEGEKGRLPKLSIAEKLKRSRLLKKIEGGDFKAPADGIAEAILGALSAYDNLAMNKLQSFSSHGVGKKMFNAALALRAAGKDPAGATQSQRKGGRHNLLSKENVHRVNRELTMRSFKLESVRYGGGCESEFVDLVHKIIADSMDPATTNTVAFRAGSFRPAAKTIKGWISQVAAIRRNADIKARARKTSFMNICTAISFAVVIGVIYDRVHPYNMNCSDDISVCLYQMRGGGKAKVLTTGGYPRLHLLILTRSHISSNLLTPSPPPQMIS